MDMRTNTIIYAVLLILLGFGGYFFTGRESITALIPSFFGGIVLIMGLIAFKEDLRKHAMHGAAGLSLLGFLSTVSGIMDLFNLSEVARPAAAVSRSIMAVLSLLF